MSESFFFDNFYYNFLTSFVFLSINFIFSIFLAEKRSVYKIQITEPHLIFFTIISIYAFLVNSLILLNKTQYLFYAVALLLICSVFCLICFANYKKLLNYFPKYKNIDKCLLLFFVIFLFISILPFSDADSVAIHMNIPAQIMHHGVLNTDLVRNIENTLISNTESILSLSFILKSDNFGSQLNFFSLVVFLFVFRKNKYFYYILFCSPLIIFFISTQKLQLFFGIIYLSLFILIFENKLKNNYEIFLFAFLLVFYSSGKLTYLLFSFFLFLFFLFKNKNSIKKIFLYLFICFFIHQFPLLLYKFILFQNFIPPFFDSFFNNREVFFAFTESIRSSEGWLSNFSISSVLRPFFTINISQLSTTFGMCFVLLILNYKKIKELYYIPYLIILSVFISGQLLPRYFLEAFLIMAFYANNSDLFKVINFFQGGVVILLSLGFLFYSSFYLASNSWSKSLFLDRFSYSHENAKKVNQKKLTGNVLVLAFARDSIFYDKNIYSSRYLDIMNAYNGNYEENIKKVISMNKIKFVIFNDLSKLPNCVNVNLLDEIYFNKVTRNFLINNNKVKYKIGEIVSNECK